MTLDLLLLRPIWSTHMFVAQIPQHLLVFFAHPAREVRIIQVPVARRFGHILQNAQPLLNSFLPLGRQLLPPWQHVIADVLPLLRRHPLPDARAVAKLLLLRRRKTAQSPLVLRQPLAILRSHIPQTFLRIRRWRSSRLRPIRVVAEITPTVRGVRTRIFIRARTILT